LSNRPCWLTQLMLYYRPMLKQLSLITLLLFNIVACSTATPTPEPTATRPALTVDNFEPIHARYVQEFVDTEGFGMSRVISNPFFQESHPFTINHHEYNVTQLELISLLEHNPPAIYITSGRPSKDFLAHSETRPLTTVEQTLLQSIVSGQNVVITPDQNGLIMLGALRPQTACLECHDTNEQNLLGVFIYHLNTIITNTTKM